MSPNALALVELLIRERRALSRFIARYLDPASTEDTLQNLYLKASSVPGDPPILEPRGYLYRMAYHHALNRSQADARERRAMAEYAVDMGDAGHDGEAQALDQAQLREITQTILALPAQVRECFVLNRYLGLSEREIAARLGISKSLVGKHVLRAAADPTTAAGNASMSGDYRGQIAPAVVTTGKRTRSWCGRPQS